MIRPAAHLGPRVSALLDGQLPAEESERAWRHVAACASCRSAVHREEWVKRRLSRLAADSSVPAELAAVLARLPSGPAAGLPGAEGHPGPYGTAVGYQERAGRGRGARLTVAAIGVGSLSAALVVLGAGYVAESSTDPREPTAPAGTTPVNAWISQLGVDEAAIQRGAGAHRPRRPWARMEP